MLKILGVRADTVGGAAATIVLGVVLIAVGIGRGGWLLPIAGAVVIARGLFSFALSARRGRG